MDILDSLAPLRYRAERPLALKDEDEQRPRTAVGWLAAGLLAPAWLPGATAALGGAPAGPEGWLFLAAGGLPLGLAWLLPGRRRMAAFWMASAALAVLSVLWCVSAVSSGSGIQAVGAAVIGLPVWLLPKRPRRRRKAAWLTNSVFLLWSASR